MRLERPLRTITSLIVECCDPAAVLLFGSFTKGQDSADSDLDILVIGDFRETSYLRGREVRELLSRFPIQIDVRLATPEEVARESREPYRFLSSVLTGSEVLYKKAGIGCLQRAVFEEICRRFGST